MRLPLSRLQAMCAFSLLTGCALPGQVQRFNVEYNTAVAGMADQLTLLNIARAKEGVPTFYTSVSQITGTITVKATANVTGQFKADQPTTTSSTTNQSALGSGTSLSNVTGSGTSGSLSTVTGANAGSTAMGGSTTSLSNTTGSITSAMNTITNLAQTAVARGGNIYTPTIGGEVDSGPSFQVNILDTQEFYQGILSGVDPAVLMNYLDQGVESDLIFYLLTARIEFQATEDTTIDGRDAKGNVKKWHFTKGEVVGGWTNAALDFRPRETGGLNEGQASEFWPDAACYVLQTKESRDPDQQIALASKIFDEGDGKSGLKLSDLATIDGSQLTLSRAPGADADAPLYLGSTKLPDSSILFVRPSKSKEVLALSVRPAAGAKSCDPPEIPNTLGMTPDAASKAIATAAAHYVFWNSTRFYPDPTADARSGSANDRGDVTMYTNGLEMFHLKAKAVVVLRSPESVVQYVGAYARYFENRPAGPTPGDPYDRFLVNGKQLFTLGEGDKCEDEVVGVNLLKHHYCVPRDQLRPDMKVLALIEQLINLHKSAKDRPSTLPVEFLP